MWYNFGVFSFFCAMYKEYKIMMKPGDRLLIYTDGVTEATNKDKKLFTEERLLNTLNKKEYTSMKELCTEVKSDVDAFVNGEDQFDDITMLMIEYRGE